MALDRPISSLLTDPDREWTAKAPAPEVELGRLRQRVPFELPEEYIELLRFCNGGEGELDLPPLWFQMSSIEESISHNDFWKKEGEYAHFWFIGSNGGLESIAFDLRIGPPYPIVMIDCIAGDSSAVRIAENVGDFIKKIGLRASETLD